MPKLRLALFCLALTLGGCNSEPAKPMVTVSSVDLQRYLGSWYEIAMLPNRFQAMCASDTQAQYRQDGDRIQVRNRCRKADGSVEEAIGQAKVVEGSGNAKLRVSFFWPFYGNYWVLALDDNYQWVLVGEPGREYGWVLARSPGMDEPTLTRVLDKAASLGYNRSAFQRTPQPQPLD